jgi:two-component system, NarL family, response regulator YdfI
MLEVIIMAPSARRRDWLQRVLQGRPGIRVAGISPTFSFLRSLMSEKIPDIVLVDLESVPDFDLARDWLHELTELAPVVLLAAAPDPAVFNRLVQAASGAMLRADASAEQIVRAIEAASNGLITFDSSLIAESETLDELSEELTSRETEVLRLLAEGFGNREIANRLEISEHTIKFHIRSILGKLGASTRTEAVTRGFRAGLIDL